MKKLKNLIRSRRGIAIEFAIGIMLVSVAISTILLSTAVLEGERKRSDLDKFEEFVFDYSREEVEAAIRGNWRDCLVNNEKQFQVNGIYYEYVVIIDDEGSVEEVKIKRMTDGKIITTNITLDDDEITTIDFIE